MRKDRILIVAIAAFAAIVAGLIVWRRFDVPPQLHVQVVAAQGSSIEAGQTFRRGQLVETGAGEYLVLQVGDDLFVALDERSRLELTRLFYDERIFTFTRGRIVVDSRGAQPILIETNKSQNVVERGRATFINYDFQQLVTIAPMDGSVQTHIKGTKDYLLVPVPLNVSETDPPSFSKTTFHPSEGAAATFHAWTDATLPNQ